MGTSMTVRSLFARLPARRKFLRAPGSETNAVVAASQPLCAGLPGGALDVDAGRAAGATDARERRPARCR